MLTMYDNEQYFFQALRAGAAGYVLKSVADRDLLEACHAAIRGPSFTRSGGRADPQLAEPCPVRSGDPAADTDSPRGGGPQTRREGHSSKEIADTLFISIKTVERHRANMLQKLGLRDRLELARYAIRAGTI